MEFGENDVEVIGAEGMPSYVRPGRARDSALVRKLNPPQRFPAVDGNTRAFEGAVHPRDVGGEELTADEYYRIILNIDMGAQYFFRENKGQ